MKTQTGTPKNIIQNIQPLTLKLAISGNSEYLLHRNHCSTVPESQCGFSGTGKVAGKHLQH